MIVLAAFWLLLGLTIANRSDRERMLKRTRDEWVLDASGLIAQGVLVPAAGITLFYGMWMRFFPAAHGVLDLPAWGAFLLNFVGVDYLYYWNHRLLHGTTLWPVHSAHHSSERLDVISTSRNTLWTPVLIVYLWVNGLLVFLLRNPEAYLLGASLTAALDLWRHTGFFAQAGSALHRALRPFLVTPHEHAWHHSADRHGVNFGANWSLWDRMHGTYWGSDRRPKKLGVSEVGSPRELLWNPYSARRRRA